MKTWCYAAPMTPEIRKHCKDCIKWLLLFKILLRWMFPSLLRSIKSGCYITSSKGAAGLYTFSVQSHMKWKLMRFKSFLNISEKSFISVSHLETARIEGGRAPGRAPYFFHKILLSFFFFSCCCEFALRNSHRVSSQFFHLPFSTDPWEFSYLPSPWPLPLV